MQLMQIVLLKKLRKYGKDLTRQQYKTIKGQILAGDTEGAAKGMNKLLERAEKEKGGERCGKEEGNRNRVPVGTTAE